MTAVRKPHPSDAYVPRSSVLDAPLLSYPIAAAVSMLMRKFLRRGAPAAQSLVTRRYLIPDETTPLTKAFCAKTMTSTIGIEKRTEAAMTCAQLALPVDEKKDCIPSDRV